VANEQSQDYFQTIFDIIMCRKIGICGALFWSGSKYPFYGFGDDVGKRSQRQKHCCAGITICFYCLLDNQNHYKLTIFIIGEIISFI
jgi:hypothetical protein